MPSVWACVLCVVLLAGCQLFAPVPPKPELVNLTPAPTLTHRPPPTAAPSPSPTVPPASPTPDARLAQAEALVPDAQGDLAMTADLNRYTIDLNLDVQALTYTGHETLDYTNATTVTLDTLVFRLFPNAPVIFGSGALTVTQATVDGQTATFQVESTNKTALRLALPQPVEPGGQRQVGLEFEGRVPRDFGLGRKGYGIFNFGQDVLTLADFYPILAVYTGQRWKVDPVYAEGDAVFSQAAFYTLNLTVPADWTVAATGVEVERTARGEQVQRTYVSGPVRDFMLALSPDFRAISRKVGDTAVNAFFQTDHQAGGEQALDFASNALASYNRRFGLYPYRELDVVEAPLNLAAGVEYPGLVLISSSFYTHTQDQFFEFATVHEVAHQWWYNVVGNDVIDHPWEDEALAQYSSAIYAQDVDGQAQFEGILKFFRDQVDQAPKTCTDDAVGASLADFADTSCYGPIVYEKGPLFFQAVRERIGDAAFFESLQRYYRTYKYRIAPPRGFIDVAEQVSGQNLDDLYQTWILGTESPQQ
jgi:aminopeptidase N